MTSSTDTPRQRLGPRRGRPPLDWKDPDDLIDEPPGTMIVFYASWTSNRVVARIIDTDCVGTITIEEKGADHLREVEVAAQVKRYRVVGTEWEVGEDVAHRHKTVEEWRGTITAVDGDAITVMVGPDDHSEVVPADELTTPEIKLRRPRNKPGRVHSDPAAEWINSKEYRERGS